MVFDYGPPLPGHANGMVLRAFDAAGNLHLAETYYSIGGGFVLTERELKGASLKGDDAEVTRPYPFATAAEMLAMGEASGLSIAAMKRANETAGGHATLDAGLDRLWSVMDDCIDRGLATDGTLPGGLKVRRRAHAIHQALARRARQQPRPAAHRQRLALGLRHGGQRGERRRRPRRHRARPTAPPAWCRRSSATTATTASARPTAASATSC